MKKRLLLLALGFVAVMLAFPVHGTNAQSVGGKNTPGCVLGPFVAYSGSTTGYSDWDVRFHINLPDASTVRWHWEHSNGQQGPSAWLHGPYDLFVNDTNPPYQQSSGSWSAALHAHVLPGTSGTVRFVIEKAASYGTCFEVANVVVTRIPYTTVNPGPTPPPNGGGFATPSPSPTGQTPAPGPTTTAAPSGACAPIGDSIPASCPPPPGYCWAQGPGTEPGTWPIAPCGSSPSPSPSPTPSGPAPNTCTWHYAQGTNGSATGLSGTGDCTAHTGDTGTYTISGPPTTTYGGAYVSCKVNWGPGGSDFALVFNPGAGAEDHVGASLVGTAVPFIAGFTVASAAGLGFSYNFGSDAWYSQGGTCDISVTWNANANHVLPSPSASSSASGSPSGTPTLPPGWFPPGFQSQDPNQSQDPINAKICVDDPSILACQHIPSSVPTPDASGALTGFDLLVDHLMSKAPFGYANQVANAIGAAAGNAAGGNAGVGGCYGCLQLPWWNAAAGQEQTVTANIPVSQYATAAAPFRAALLGLLLISFAVASLRWIVSLSGGGTE